MSSRLNMLASLALVIMLASTTYARSGHPSLTEIIHDGSTNASILYGMSTGMNSLRWLDDSSLSDQLDDYVTLGVKMIRTDFYWDVIQGGGQNSYDWSSTDRVVNFSLSRGINVLGIFNGVPSWALSASGAIEDINDFANFASEAAGRYAPLGVHTWEIWNEPNINWNPSPDAVAYTDVMMALYKAVKQVDSTSVVLMGGLSPSPSTTSCCIGAVDFLTTVYAQGGKDFMDVVSFHPYSYPLMPSNTDSWNGWMMMQNNTPSLISVMSDNGDSDKQIWITEFGAPTNVVSEADQSTMLQEAFSMAETYDWCAAVLYYSYIDLGTDTSNNEDFFWVGKI